MQGKPSFGTLPSHSAPGNWEHKPQLSGKEGKEKDKISEVVNPKNSSQLSFIP